MGAGLPLHARCLGPSRGPRPDRLPRARVRGTPGASVQNATAPAPGGPEPSGIQTGVTPDAARHALSANRPAPALGQVRVLHHLEVPGRLLVQPQVLLE